MAHRSAYRIITAKQARAERQALQRVAKESLERVDAVKRAKALLAVAEGKTFTQAGVSAGLSRDGVSQLVQRFNQRGLAVLVIAPGRGRKPTSLSQGLFRRREVGVVALAL